MLHDDSADCEAGGGGRPARERLEKIRAEELDEDRARMLAVFQVVRLLDALGLRDVADAVEEFV